MSALLEDLEPLRLPALLLERDGRIVWQNDRLGDLCGPLVGQNAEACWFMAGRGGGAETLRAILTSGESCELSLTVTDGDGAARVLQYSAVPVEHELTLVAIFGLHT